MGPDDDLAKLLPEAPPRPDRREAAIAEAMRRFDGGEVPPPAAPARRPAFAWPNIGRPQLGVLMSMGLLVVIGAPLALMTIREQPRGIGEREQVSRNEAGTSSAAPPATPAAAPGRARPQAVQSPARPLPVDARDSSARDEPISPAALREQPGSMAPAAPAAPPPPPPPPAALVDAFAAKTGAVARRTAAHESDEAIIVQGARIARRSEDTPVAITAVGEEEIDDRSIVVTGSGTSRAARRAGQRGDWNACTVDDPAQALDRCKREVNPGAKGAAGLAAARIADGLTQAWNGNLKHAITAFDAAIEISPKRAFAYLNRGLAYRRLGETERAIKEFDQSVRFAPDDARGYYHRSVALRVLGNIRRARDDEARAIRLDGRYERLFD